MNKILIAILTLLVIGGGGAAFVMSQNDDTNESSNSSSTTEEKQTEKKQSSTPEFNPLATANESFKANMTVTSTDGSGTFTGLIEKDESGNTKFSGEQDGEKIEFYLTPKGKYIVCQDTECFSLTGGTAPLDTSDFTASDADILKYKETAKFKGEQDCASGTCDAWEYVDEEGSNVTILISQKDQRVMEVQGSDEDGSSVVIKYEYTDVSVTLPENVQEFPGGI